MNCPPSSKTCCEPSRDSAVPKDTVWVPNKKHRAGDWKLVGFTRSGRALTVIVRSYEDRRVLRPITGWDCTVGDVSKYLGR